MSWRNPFRCPVSREHATRYIIGSRITSALERFEEIHEFIKEISSLESIFDVNLKDICMNTIICVNFI